MSAGAPTSEVLITDLDGLLADSLVKIRSLTADLRRLSATSRSGGEASALRLEIFSVLTITARLQLTASRACQQLTSEPERATALSRLRELQLGTWNLVDAASQIFPELLA
jgi:hypothetical protein